MIEIKTKLRKWGNSLGVVVPMNSLQEENFKENDEVILLITKEKENVLRKMFGKHKFKKPVSKIMKEIDKELWPNE